MIRSLLIVLVLALSACGPDSTPFGVTVVLERGDTQRCSSDDCIGIKMSCDALVLIRIVDNTDDRLVWVSECIPVEQAGDLCALNSIDVDSQLVANGLVRIQIAVWPYTDEIAAGFEADGLCPIVRFTNGKIETVHDPLNPPPAIGGEAFFEVGSSSLASVVLGCLDEEQLDADSCQNAGTVQVAAGVLDFDTNVSVSPTLMNLVVSIGEPRFDGDTWTLAPEDTAPLTRTVLGGSPVWQGDVDLDFVDAACIQVFEITTGAATTLSCHAASVADAMLNLDGVYLRKTTLDVLQEALGGSFPPGGLVVGRVLDHTGQPAIGATVTPSEAATVQYLSADMSTIDPGTVTTASGAFLAMDAPFDTSWTTSLDQADQVEVQLGGCVEGKVTIVELQLQNPVKP